LNWGDGGLRTLFARFQKQLRPNGLLILEIQPWSSYKKKKAMTADTYKHFKEIKMRPNQFPEVLEKEYGLKLERRLEPPTGSAEGFDRPIDVFRNVGVEPQK
jgi:7SK snRNA methylphosphate capping enzyme